jgi:hypothetical protein
VAGKTNIGNPVTHRLVAQILIVLLALPGCGGRTRQDYVPPPEAARAALTKAMEAWRQGEPPGRIEGQPAIQVGDTHRRAGQKLARYEIVGGLPSDEGKLFAVRVELENPAAQEKINYLVVGIDPLWVFRQEDYQMVTHWEHNMPAAGSTKPEAPNSKQIQNAKTE